MATLTGFFTEIADAIREVEGSVEAIPAPTFPDRIRNLTVAVDFTRLAAAIADATARKDETKVAGSGDYDFGTEVTTQGAIDALALAISTAQGAYDTYKTGPVTQALLNDAQEALEGAVSTFEAAITQVTPDTSALTAQESRYTTLKTGVSTSANGKDVTFGGKWVTSAEQSAADTALSTARSTVEAATKQSQINAAVSTLTSALDTYQAAIKTATKDTAALDAAISAANAAKADVSASDQEGADLPAGSKYVTMAQMKALTDAIAAATTAKTASTTQAQLDAATSTLTTATSTFEGQVKTNRPSIPADQSAFNATSWEDMALLSADCAKVGASDYQKLLGFMKDVAVSGVGTVKARLIGLNHDDLVSGGKAGFTFQLTDGLSTSAPASFQMNSSNTNSGGWASSLMRSTNLPKLKAALPADLQGVIKKVTKKTSTANSGTAVSDTEDDLFLLSLVESIGTTKTAYTDNPVASGNYLYNEGSQYEYYKQFDGNKTEAFNHHIINQASGGAQIWWLRSIRLGNTTGFYVMRTSGGWNYHNASNAYLPAAGFAL